MGEPHRSYESVDRAERARELRSNAAELDRWHRRCNDLAALLDECAKAAREKTAGEVLWAVDQIGEIKTALESVALHLNHEATEEMENG